MNTIVSMIQSLWRSHPTLVRRGLGIAVALVLLGCVAYTLGQTLVVSVGSITSDVPGELDFLLQPVGFAVDAGLFRLQATQPYWQAFWVGTCNTLGVALLGIVLATVLGVLLGVGHYASNVLVRRVCLGYVQCVQNIPLLLQLLMWYACLGRALPSAFNALALGPFLISKNGVDFPVLVWQSGQMGTVAGLLAVVVLGWVAGMAYRRWAIHRFEATRHSHGLVWMPVVLVLAGCAVAWVVSLSIAWNYPQGIAGTDNGGGTATLEFLALWLGLSCHGSSLIAGVVCSGMARVPRGQFEAACALGLSCFQTLRLVTLPQVLRSIVVPLSKQYISLVKNSSMAVAIGYPDVLSMATMTLHHTGRVAECITLMLLIYVIIYLLAAGFARVYQRLTHPHQPWLPHQSNHSRHSPHPPTNQVSL